MNHQPAFPAVPIPFRRLLLMPWRWGRWTRWMICTMVIAVSPLYFLSAVPVTRVLRQKYQAYRIAAIADKAYRPVWMCRRWQPATNIIVWEERMMDRFLGQEQHAISY
jgi:predicted lysophospholipase L1 biosynthesis ABC-type transport system permease subunit